MQITIKLDDETIAKLREVLHEEFLDATTRLLSEVKVKSKGKKPSLKEENLEAAAQAEVAKAAAAPPVEITDEDLPENMRPEKKSDTKFEGLPEVENDRPVADADKAELTPRIRALNLGQGVLREWIKRNTGSDDGWSIGYHRFKLMLDLFEAKKSESNEAIAKFIAGV